MTTTRRVDVLVVGAGPAGCAAATVLARKGHQVLLLDGRSAADARPAAPHDVMLSVVAVDALATLGAPPFEGLRPVGTLEAWFGPETRRSFGGEVGVAVADRDGLQAWLCGAAARDAELLRARVVSIAARAGGYAVRLGSADGSVIWARQVVIATGPGGAALIDPGDDGPRVHAHGGGVAVARRFSGAGDDPRMVLHFSAPPSTDPRAAPVGVWVLPGAGATCTVGAVAVGGDRPPPAAEELLATAVRRLTEADARFAALRPCGEAAAGTVDTGFAPQRGAHTGCLLVGDAAGLVNPFTGEGFSHAVQSGMLAAEAIAAHPEDPAAASHAYVRSLGAMFVGYFETARHAARRYHLAWRVLAATARGDRPLFALTRRAMLLPGGLVGSAAAPTALPPADLLFMGPFLAGCDESAVAAVRGEWPFIARLLIAGKGTSLRLRPAAVFLAALAASGKPPDLALAKVGAAVDLAALGALALIGPLGGTAPARGVDWEPAVTVLACDFLLAQAARLVAAAAPGASWAFADWLGELARLRAARLSPGEPAVGAGALFAALLEFPARVGAELGGADPEDAERVRDFGHHCGRAFLLAEDVLALRGQRTRLDTTTEAMLEARLSMLPELLGRPALTPDLLTARPGLRAAGLAAALEACNGEIRSALAVLGDLGSPVAARILRAHALAIADSIGPASPRPAARPERKPGETHEPS